MSKLIYNLTTYLTYYTLMAKTFKTQEKNRYQVIQKALISTNYISICIYKCWKHHQNRFYHSTKWDPLPLVN